jgi:hypothetical protein
MHHWQHSLPLTMADAVAPSAYALRSVAHSFDDIWGFPTFRSFPQELVENAGSIHRRNWRYFQPRTS